MWPSPISSERPSRRRRARGRQDGGILFWALVVIVGAGIGAFVVFQLVIRNLQASLLVTDEVLHAYVAQNLEVKATVLNELNIAIDEVVSTRVPVDTMLSVPVEEPLRLVANFDAMVPIRTNVPVRDVIPLEQDVDIDTVVEADLLGETFELPLRGRFPVRAEVPVSLIVPIDQEVRLKFSAPITARLKQNLEVPLKTEIVADVPLKTQMSVPVLNNLDAIASIPQTPTLPVRLNYADLLLPLGDMRFGLRDDGDKTSAEPADPGVQP